MAEEPKVTTNVPAHCATCTSFKRTDYLNHPEDTDQVSPGMMAGECRRHAPITHHTWPATRGSDWCGDHVYDQVKLEQGCRTS